METYQHARGMCSHNHNEAIIQTTNIVRLPFAASKLLMCWLIDRLDYCDVCQGLKEALGQPLPSLENPDCNQILSELLVKHGIELTPPHTTARLIDALVGHFLEDKCIQPTFICDHPEIMSPLAKYHRSLPLMTERFELFVCGKEVSVACLEFQLIYVYRDIDTLFQILCWFSGILGNK